MQFEQIMCACMYVSCHLLSSFFHKRTANVTWSNHCSLTRRNRTANAIWLQASALYSSEFFLFTVSDSDTLQLQSLPPKGPYKLLLQRINMILFIFNTGIITGIIYPLALPSCFLPFTRCHHTNQQQPALLDTQPVFLWFVWLLFLSPVKLLHADENWIRQVCDMCIRENASPCQIHGVSSTCSPPHNPLPPPSPLPTPFHTLLSCSNETRALVCAAATYVVTENNIAQQPTGTDSLIWYVDKGRCVVRIRGMRRPSTSSRCVAVCCSELQCNEWLTPLSDAMGKGKLGGAYPGYRKVIYLSEVWYSMLQCIAVCTVRRMTYSLIYGDWRRKARWCGSGVWKGLSR